MDWTPIFYWTGVGVWVLAGCALVAFVVAVIANSINAARFVLRMWRAVPDDRNMKLWAELDVYWLRLSLLISSPPTKITDTQTGASIYWPGCEQPETFPA